MSAKKSTESIPVIFTPVEFDQCVKSAGTNGAYLFFGEEDYLKRVYADKLRRNVFGGQTDDPFNHILFDADSYSQKALSEAIQTLPVLSERKLIEIRGIALDRAEIIQGLCDALEDLYEYEYSIILIYALSGELDAGNEKQPSKIISELTQYLTAVRFAHETPVRLAKWAEKHFISEGVEVTEKICAELIAFCGRDMSTLDSEIIKIAAYVKSHGRGSVTNEDIRAVCSAAGELDSFALANAVLNGDRDGAMAALREALSRREPPEILLASISRVFCDLFAVKSCLDSGMGRRDISEKLKMHEYKTGLYIGACKNHTSEALAETVGRCKSADLKLKSTSIESEVILQRLAIYK